MKTCKQCNFTGDNCFFVPMRNTCLKCNLENIKQKEALITDEDREKSKERNRESSRSYRRNNPYTVSKCNHEYYMAHKAESLQRCRKNRDIKKLKLEKLELFKATPSVLKE